MKHLLKYFIAILILLMTHGASFSKATNAQMEEIMRLSGLNKQIAQFPDSVVVGLNSPQVQQHGLSGKAISLMKEAMEEAYQPEVIMSAIRAAVADKFTEQEYSAMKTWYVSDPGIEITAAEARASTPQAMQEMMQNAASILSNQERIPMAIELDSLVGASDIATRMNMYTALAVFRAMAALRGEDSSQAVQDFEARLSAQEELIRQQSRQMVILSFLYSYQDISEDKMNLYLDYLRTPASKKLHQAFMRGLETGMGEAADIMAFSLSQKLKENFGD